MLGLTEKETAFIHEYINNGYNGVEAYLKVYNTTNRQTAYTESRRLLQKDKITKEITKLRKPYDNEAKNERYKKIRVLWDIINDKDTKNSDKIQAINILNKMQGDYTEIMDNEIDEIEKVSTDKLLQLIG